MLKNISRGFNHYIKLVDTGGKKKEFKDLRKTYDTLIANALGKSAKLFTGHTDDETLQDRYIAKEFIAGQLSNFSIRDINRAKKIRSKTEKFPTK